MGSWSVACGISNIAITEGVKCCILPLKISKGDIKYQPATLPIFGEYDDCGGLEDIIKDDNTEYIESYFGITIEEFVTYLVDGKFTYNRDNVNDIVSKMLNHNEASEWRFMWIEYSVYEEMIKDYDDYYNGYNDYGTPITWRLMSKSFISGNFREVFGSRYELDLDLSHLIDELGDDISPSMLDYFNKKKALKNTFHNNYYERFEQFGDRIADLTQLMINLHPMSGELRPHTLYLTPQCGEHDKHLKIMTKFVEILSKKVNYEDDETN